MTSSHLRFCLHPSQPSETFASIQRQFYGTNCGTEGKLFEKVKNWLDYLLSFRI